MFFSVYFRSVFWSTVYSLSIISKGSCNSYVHVVRTESFMQDFAQLAIPEQLKENIAKERFHTPTPIQKRAIPFALEGRDILGISQTGSGKTAAFAIPLLAHLLTNQDGHALILTPTRELATQVFAHVKRLLGKASRIGMALLIGGASYHQQMQQLKRHPRLIIARQGVQLITWREL